MSALDTLPNPQSSKVGKTEKSKPAISKRKSPNQRGYENVRLRGAQKGGDCPRGSAGGNRGNISFPVWLKQRSKKLKSIYDKL